MREAGAERTLEERAGRLSSRWGAAVVRQFGEKSSASDGVRPPSSLMHQVVAELIFGMKVKGINGMNLHIACI